MAPHKALADFETTVRGTEAQGDQRKVTVGPSLSRRTCAQDPPSLPSGSEAAWRARLRRLSVMIHVCTVAALLAIAVPTPAESQQSSPNGWPPISPEELALKDDPANPGARAILLYREVETDDVKSFETNYYRIKILTESGKKYADVEIPYVEKATEIRDIRARTVQPDGQATDFNGQVFDKLVVKTRRIKFQAKTFTLPDVRAGSIVEYSYTVHWRGKMPDILRHPENYRSSPKTVIGLRGF